MNRNTKIALFALSISHISRADLSADLAAAVDAPYLSFTTAGNAPWLVDTGTSVVGNNSIRNGYIEHVTN